MNGLLSRMTASTELVFADGTSKLIKTRLDPIQMQVFTRSGNKKVLISYSYHCDSNSHIDSILYQNIFYI